MSDAAPRPVGVLVARPEPEASRLAERLTAQGYRPFVSPMLRYVRQARLRPSDFDGVGAVAVTSAAAAQALVEDGARSLPGFAVGEKTAAAARAAGLDPVHVGAGTASDLARLIAEAPPKGAVLFARGRETAGDLAGLLSVAGVAVRERVVYAAETVEALSSDAAAGLSEGAVDVALSLSARTSEALVQALSPHAPVGLSALCLSAEAARPLLANSVDIGLRSVDWVETPTLAGLLMRLEARFPPPKRVC